jgi:hypothetical protein
MLYFPLIFLKFIYQNVSNGAIIHELDLILHGFILQIIYTTAFRVTRLNNLTLRIR